MINFGSLSNIHKLIKANGGVTSGRSFDVESVDVHQLEIDHDEFHSEGASLIRDRIFSLVYENLKAIHGIGDIEGKYIFVGVDSIDFLQPKMSKFKAAKKPARAVGLLNELEREDMDIYSELFDFSFDVREYWRCLDMLKFESVFFGLGSFSTDEYQAHILTNTAPNSAIDTNYLNSVFAGQCKRLPAGPMDAQYFDLRGVL